MSKTEPRGVRNHNPGNIRWGDPWQGLVPVNERTDKSFCQFISPAYGIRAMARTLITYQDKHQLRTIKDVITRWAPPSENNTQAYIDSVSRAMARGATEILDLHTYDALRPLLNAIIYHENGRGPLMTANTWYDSATVDEGLRLAGVRKEQTSKVPVTKETIGATATGGVGIAQIAEALPAVAQAVDKADGHLSSGSVVRVVIGLVLIGIAAFIAYSQIKRHEAGQL